MVDSIYFIPRVYFFEGQHIGLFDNALVVIVISTDTPELKGTQQ